MIRFFVFFFFIPIFSSAQSNISINIIERTDATKELKRIFNYSLESYIYKNITLGLTNAKASADYIKEGYSPIQDSLVISNYQIFSKYYVLNNLFFLIQSPISTNNKTISVFERIRVGGGYYFYFKKSGVE